MGILMELGTSGLLYWKGKCTLVRTKIYRPDPWTHSWPEGCHWCEAAASLWQGSIHCPLRRSELLMQGRRIRSGRAVGRPKKLGDPWMSLTPRQCCLLNEGRQWCSGDNHVAVPTSHNGRSLRRKTWLSTIRSNGSLRAGRNKVCAEQRNLIEQRMADCWCIKEDENNIV